MQRASLPKFQTLHNDCVGWLDDQQDTADFRKRPLLQHMNALVHVHVKVSMEQDQYCSGRVIPLKAKMLY